ncbi:MAG: ArnT family glycosyltransferase [Candidatus Woesearchaeota archaeon]
MVFNIVLAGRYYSTEMPSGDQALYYKIATTILDDGIFPDKDGYDIGLVMAPGYSFLLAGVFAIFGNNIANAFFLNIIFHLLSALILFYLINKNTNKWFAWGFSLWLLLAYQIWRMNYNMMMEISTIFFITISLYFLYKYLKTKAIRNIVIFGILMGLLIFLNNRFIFHAVVLGGIMFIYGILQNRKAFQLKDPFIYGVFIILILLPWHIRQYIQYDEFVFFSPARTEVVSGSITADGEQGKKSGNITPDKLLSYEECLDRFENISGMTASRMENIRKNFTKEKYHQMVKNYKNKYDNSYAKYISRLTGFWEIWEFDFSFGFGGDTRISPPARKKANLVNIVVLTPMFLFFIIGLFYAFYRNNIFFQFLVYFVISHWLLHALVHYISRYRITVLPLIFIIAWYGIYQLAEHTGILNKAEKVMLKKAKNY